ncbi:hypothetical protein WP50_30105 [Lactiplantibacillus plantarum]|nr:hypothetical protein WP50_30105 [Lactiplantibacillus plantarum]
MTAEKQFGYRWLSWYPAKMNLLVLTTSAFLLALDVILYKIAIGPAYFQLSFGFLSMAVFFDLVLNY